LFIDNRNPQHKKSQILPGALADQKAKQFAKNDSTRKKWAKKKNRRERCQERGCSKRPPARASMREAARLTFSRRQCGDIQIAVGGTSRPDV
jgi:hypothetical protein